MEVIQLASDKQHPTVKPKWQFYPAVERCFTSTDFVMETEDFKINWSICKMIVQE
jgi:hypothetical protein